MAAFTYCPRCATALVDREHSGRTRRACPGEGCGFVHWGNPLPVVAAVVELPGGVVLARAPGWPEKFFARLNRLLPRVVDRALRGQLATIRRFAHSESEEIRS